MKELLEAGKVTPVIDRRFPLRDVADAIRYYHILDHAKRGEPHNGVISSHNRLHRPFSSSQSVPINIGIVLNDN